MLIVVTGNDGVGKTTFARMLAECLGGVVLEEPFAENPFGLDYLQDPQTWAYQAEVEFIRRRARAVREQAQTTVPIVCDRFVWDDVEVFARLWADLGVFEHRELESLRLLAEDLTRDLPTSAKTIWLRASLRCMTSRIGQRPFYPMALTLEQITDKRDRLYAEWLADRDDVEQLDTTDRSLESLRREAERIAGVILRARHSES